MRLLLVVAIYVYCIIFTYLVDTETLAAHQAARTHVTYMHRFLANPDTGTTGELFGRVWEFSEEEAAIGSLQIKNETSCAKRSRTCDKGPCSSP